jgi:hypothetical protein
VLLNERANRRFRDRVRAVQLPEEYREASSTRVRRGEAEDVPAVVADYLERYRPFKEPSP